MLPAHQAIPYYPSFKSPTLWAFIIGIIRYALMLCVYLVYGDGCGGAGRRFAARLVGLRRSPSFQQCNAEELVTRVRMDAPQYNNKKNPNDESRQRNGDHRRRIQPLHAYFPSASTQRLMRPTST